MYTEKRKDTMNTNDPDYIPPEVCLDKCKCRGTPLFREIPMRPVEHIAMCTRCVYQTGYHPKQFQAMVEWNKRQRGVV